MVMSLVREAGYQGCVAFSAYRTLPLSTSITSWASAAAGDEVNPIAAPASATHIKVAATEACLNCCTISGPSLSGPRERTKSLTEGPVLGDRERQVKARPPDRRAPC